MLGFTRKVDYALVALACLVEQGGEAEPLSARQIADRYNLPLPLLMNVLKDLQRAGVVASTRGPKGGYYLDGDPERISIISVVEAIDGPIQMTACCGETDDEVDQSTLCQLAGQCPMSGPVQRLHGHIVQYLENVSLDQLLRGREKPVGAAAVS